MDVQELALTAGRCALMYVFFLVVLRLLGKRTVGNFTPFDFLVALMLGEVVDEIIYGDVSLAQGLLVVVVIAALHWLNSWLSFRSPAFERVTAGEPVLLVKAGRLQRDGMARERMSEDEVWEELRMMEIDDLAEVKEARLETSGQVSVLREEWAKELQKGDLPGAERKRSEKAADDDKKATSKKPNGKKGGR